MTPMIEITAPIAARELAAAPNAALEAARRKYVAEYLDDLAAGYDAALDLRPTYAPPRPALALATCSAQWAFAGSQDAEQWSGPCASRQEAIASALDCYGAEDQPDLPVWISECRPVKDSDEAADEEWTFILTGAMERVTAAEARYERATTSKEDML